MQLTSTRVPEVVAALIVAAAEALPGVTVVDGPQPGTDLPDDVLMVGVGNAEDADPYRTSRSQFDLGGRSKETGVVRCQASTWHGDTDFAVLRARVAGWIADLEASFRVDPHLSVTCDRVTLGSSRWFHLQGPSGAGVGVHFDVQYEAWL